jgi:NNP family nitrate/nitrite transporter-like MFS transporter
MSCIVITWWCYTRRGGLLFDTEHRVPGIAGRNAPAAR